MIAASSDSDGCPQIPQPQSAVTPLVATAADVRLVARAIKDRWPMSRKKRRDVVNELHRINQECEDEATRVSAANALRAIDSLNIEAQKKPPQHVHFHASEQKQGTAPAEFDPDYAEFLRQRALQCDVHTGTVCQGGKPGQMANGSAPSGNGSGHNGNGNGNGKH